MASICLTDTDACVNFFQQRILRAVAYWQNHDAVNSLEIAYLDRERDAILKAIALGLQFAPAWPLVRALIIAMTSYMERRGHWDAWHQVLQRAIAVSRRQGDTDHEVTLTALLARLCQRQSRPDDVVRYYRRVIRLARRGNNQFELARACSNLGFLYIDRGHWWRSEVLSLHALAIFEELQSEHGRAHTHNHLGLLYTRCQKWDAAEKHLIQACTIWESGSDQHNLIWGYINIGLLYIGSQQIAEAKSYLFHAQEIALVTGETTLLGQIYQNISMAYRYDEEFHAALEYAKRSEEIYQEVANELAIAQVWHNLCLIYLCLGHLLEATRYFGNALKLYRKYDFQSGQVLLYLDRVEHFLNQNDSQAVLKDLDIIDELLAKYQDRQTELFKTRFNSYQTAVAQ